MGRCPSFRRCRCVVIRTINFMRTGPVSPSIQSPRTKSPMNHRTRLSKSNTVFGDVIFWWVLGDVLHITWATFIATCKPTQHPQHQQWPHAGRDWCNVIKGTTFTPNHVLCVANAVNDRPCNGTRAPRMLNVAVSEGRARLDRPGLVQYRSEPNIAPVTAQPPGPLGQSAAPSDFLLWTYVSELAYRTLRLFSARNTSTAHDDRRRSAAARGERRARSCRAPSRGPSTPHPSHPPALYRSGKWFLNIPAELFSQILLDTWEMYGVVKVVILDMFQRVSWRMELFVHMMQVWSQWMIIGTIFYLNRYMSNKKFLDSFLIFCDLMVTFRCGQATLDRLPHPEFLPAWTQSTLPTEAVGHETYLKKIPRHGCFSKYTIHCFFNFIF